jgi:RimJ/RimL family protein N-acetyltransferase
MAIAPEQFTTLRLAATRLHARDLADLCVLHRDPRVMATLGGIRTDAQTLEYLDRGVAHWERHGFGLWTLRSTQGAFMGRAAIRHVLVDDQDEIEIAYALAADAWGRGIATEIASALLGVAFDRLRLPDVTAITTTDNRASQRVLEKVGLTLERSLVFLGAPCVLYRIDRDDWRGTAP